MKRIACILLVALASAAWGAEETAPRAGPARLKPPKGVTLTPEQEKLLAEANAAVERGYALLLDKHEPGQAVDELRKALAIMNHIVALKGDEQQLAGVAPGNEKGTPFDKIKMSGEIERIVEIAAAFGISAPDEIDNGLHKRKIVEDAKESVKKIDAEQKKITQQLQNMAGGAGGEQPKDQQQQPGDQQPQQNNQAGQPQAAAADQNQAGQPQATQQGEGQAAPQQPAADGQQPATGGQDLAAKQDAIARELNKLAAKMGEIGRDNAGQQNPATQAFRKAGTEASTTAEMIRQGEVQAAAANSKQVERAIENAMHEAGLAGEGALEAAVSAIEKQLGKMQADQQAILNKAQEIGKGADGRAAAERTQQERAAALAIEQGKLKPQIEDVQRAVEDLARTAGGGNPAARTPENAARAELATAAAELQKNRPKQAVVNAAMKLAQGDTPAATKAMSQVQNALDAA
ncbi:MAG: hypothetical protein NTW87_34790, partial [Planctomycetota bacterium]|nr:hypothetical protein [Planctomycetota bacterium]